MKDRRAHAATFGFDFQRNAAIVIMLENIKEMRSIRLEGNEEDIEINLENGQKILAQAKSVEQSSSDFRNVRANLKKALITLSEGEQKTDASQLIFITNSPNPFKDNASKSVFGGLPTHRTFSNLPPSAQKIIEGYLQKIEHPLNLDKFTIQVFPFETDDETERYKAVMQCINDFIGSLNTNLSDGLGKRLLTIWHDSIFINGTKSFSIQLSNRPAFGKIRQTVIDCRYPHRKICSVQKSCFPRISVRDPQAVRIRRIVDIVINKWHFDLPLIIQHAIFTALGSHYGQFFAGN